MESLADQRENPRRVDAQPNLSSQMKPAHLEHRACACLRARSTSIRPSPLSLAPPPVTSRRAVCRTVAKGTVEVGLTSPL